MPKTRNPYETEFRDHIVAPAQARRSVESLAREFKSYADRVPDRLLYPDDVTHVGRISQRFYPKHSRLPSDRRNR